ncbi:MAG: DUF2909 domain-containing protein [Gammaproteobacteria bacterium HGW-Gammaproteobacteria-3]|jgi:O-antigen/teichoic acid export membrane protein|nr:MAG: DUF2909 domain-containing protein [Gammaproteobacteria bacterium HGW-Gammaproteobacteria-3]
MIIQIIVVIAFMLIIFSLGSALLNIVRHKSQENSEKAAKALTFRIGLSLVLFIFLFLAVATGVLKPHGIGERLHSNNPAPNDAVRSSPHSTD